MNRDWWEEVTEQERMNGKASAEWKKGVDGV